MNLDQQLKMEAFWAELRRRIGKYGYTMQGVFGDDQTHPYVYTIGRGLAGLPDFFIFCNVNHMQVMELVLEKFGDKTAQDLQNMTQQDSIFEIDHLFVDVDGEDQTLRGRIVYANKELVEPLAIQCYNGAVIDRPPVGFCQIFMADRGNRLPGENGFKNYSSRIRDLTGQFPQDFGQNIH